MTLEINNISKTYPNGVQALKDITLTIPRGMFGLLGPNGAGKSTLMRILATLQEPDEGGVRLDDIDVLSQKDEVRKTLGYLPQEFGVYPKVSAEDLLAHFALLKGIAEPRTRKEVVEALLRQVNLWEVRKQKLGGYSDGMKQRFGVVLALLGNPKLMIVDEPTAGFDPAERVRFLNLLSELGENSVVILSTHIVDDVSELCTRMAIIDRGEILLESEPLIAIEKMSGLIWRKVIEKSELQAVTPEWFQYLLHDLFEVNTFWELGTERVTAEQTDDGNWQVTLDVRAHKVVSDEAGVETELPMDEWVQIGVFAAGADGDELGAPLYMQMHRIRSGEQMITVTVPRKPVLAGIDPYHLLDWEEGDDGDDNIDEVKIES